VSPELLAAYLAVLPKGASRVSLQSGDFVLSVDLSPALQAPLRSDVPKLKDVPPELDGFAPSELAEMFPQLVTVDG
jgi:hypothetical protein